MKPVESQESQNDPGEAMPKPTQDLGAKRVGLILALLCATCWATVQWQGLIHVLREREKSAELVRESSFALEKSTNALIDAIGGMGIAKGDTSTFENRDQMSLTEITTELAPKMAVNEIQVKIKGFYVGMDIKAAQALLKERLVTQNWQISNITTGDDQITRDFAETNDHLLLVFESAVSSNYSLELTSGHQIPKPVGTVIAGPDGKVRSIGLDSVIVNDFFNAADMEPSEFRQQFMSSYNLPEMEPSDDLDWWITRSPDGVEIRLSNQKALVMKKVPKIEERKQAFD